MKEINADDCRRTSPSSGEAGIERISRPFRAGRVWRKYRAGGANRLWHYSRWLPDRAGLCRRST